MNLLLLPMLLVGAVALASPTERGDPVHKVVSTTMNVPAGEFQALEMDYPQDQEKQSTRLQLTMLKPNLGTKWAPMVSFCLLKSGTPNQDNGCLQFFYSERNNEIQPRRLTRAHNEKSPSVVTLGPRYKIGDQIDMSISRANNRIDFLLDGKLVFSTSASQNANKLRFSCSSVVCRVDF